MSEIQPNAPQRPIQSYVLGAILVLLLLAVFRVFAPFFSVLLWSTLLYVLLSPLHRRVTRGINFETLKGKIARNFWAAFFALGTMVIILVPFSFVLAVFFRQIVDLGHFAREFLEQGPEYLYSFFGTGSDFIRDVSAGMIDISADDIVSQLVTAVASEFQRAVLIGGNIARNIGGFSLNILLVVFTLFFFYIDGPSLANLALRAIPIRGEYISALKTKFLDITRNLFFGYIMVALLQSVVAFIVFTIFNIKGSLVLAFLTFILVFIPMVGAGLIYVPLTIFKILSGDITGGIIFFAVSLVFISGIDNVLRPLFLKDRIHLHPLIILLAILGGILVFGFNGFILGPLLVIFFLTVLDLFLAEHKIGNEDNQEHST
jgi:predicted PurR-regulated permease PerM